MISNSYLTFLERLSAGADEDIVFDGYLNRKHEWESTTKKASNRYLK